MASDEIEAELADIARLDLADPAGHQVVVEQMHRRRWYEDKPVPCRSSVGYNALRRGPSHRPGRLVDRAEPALLPRATRPPRLARDQRGRGRARRDDLVPDRPR